jgi:general secretion pathway protein F
MALFQYKAKTSPTELVEGVLEADSEASASRRLGEMGYFPLEVRLRGAGKAEMSVGALLRRRGISVRHVASMTRNLGDLLAGGLPLHRALKTMQEDEDSGRMGAVLSVLGDEIQGGASLSAALESRSDIFGPFYRSMVRAGEVSGRLADVLARLADFMDDEEDISQRIRAALTYPILVLAVGVATVFVLLGFVVPRLTSMFEDMNQVLPLPTRILMWAGDFVTSYGLVVVVFIVVALVFARTAGRGRGVAERWDELKLRVPAVKNLIIESELARYARTLATLLENGVPVLSSLEVAAATSKNLGLRKDLAAMTESVARGERLGDAFRRIGVFPSLVRGMVAAGEESGRLEGALKRAAGMLDRETERHRRAMLSMLEPALILATGLVVAFIVFAMMLPVFEIDLSVR